VTNRGLLKTHQHPTMSSLGSNYHRFRERLRRFNRHPNVATTS
jgi:hypothetical protein